MQAARGGSEREGGLAARLCGVLAQYALKARERVAAWQERRALALELERLDERELADVGLARWQIPKFVRAHPDAERLLSEMLSRLGLVDDERLRTRLTHDDVYLSCAMCRERGRCRRWLAEPGTATAPPAFCPNAWTFRQLLDAKRASSSR